jgi:hypothetical protein
MEKEPKFKVGDEVIFYNEYHGIIKKCVERPVVGRYVYHIYYPKNGEIYLTDEEDLIFGAVLKNATQDKEDLNYGK